jgi:hypothetical protein
MARRKPRITQQHCDERGEFARACIALYKYALRRPNASRPAQADEIPVRQVAAGLAAIKQAVDEKVKQESTKSLDALCATGLADALQILDALTTGRSHPIHRFVRDLHTGKFRSNTAPPNEVENLGRAIVVGAVRALRNSDPARSELEVVNLVCLHLSGSRKLTVDTVKGWNHRFMETDHLAPVGACNDLLRLVPAGVDKEKARDIILGRAQIWLQQFSNTPRFP